MHSHKKTHSILKTSALAVLSASAAFAATTPYDLIRPTWPLTWDDKAMDQFDTTISKRIGDLPDEKTPASFKAGALMPDTLDQAYLDAINTKISPIRVNQAGYLKKDAERQFYFVGDAEEFEVVDENGKSLSPKVVGTFTSSGVKTQSDWTIIAGHDATSNAKERYRVGFTGSTGNILVGNIPQSVPTEQRLRIKVGDEISSTFIVSEDVYTMVKDAAIKFFGIQRSGNSESWFHGASHTMDGSGKVVNLDGDNVEGISLNAGDLQGGWYDCGDHLKESQTQAFAFMALAVSAATNPSKDVDHYAYNQGNFVDTDKIPDVLREAKHGADFFLRSYNAAKGIIDNMAVSVGNFGSDHSWWSRPEVQDFITAKGRGGAAERDVRLGELGSNISSEIAAGLAILSKDYAKYDKDFADSCLTVAEKMYDFAKALAQGKSTYDGDKKFVYNKKAAGWSTPAYIGNEEYIDEIALASVALLYATGKKTYADDMLRNKDMVVGQSYISGVGFFDGGWFVTSDKGFFKNSKNTSWGNSYTYALYALYKLILSDKTKATTEYGLTEAEWTNAIEDCVASMIANLGDVSYGTGSSKITLPANSESWKPNTVSYDPTWYNMLADQSWTYNRYQIGNTFEVMAYADVAADIEKRGLKLTNLGSDLKSGEMFQLGINQLNYMLGVNPWDISFIYGVGDKNDNHPLHRASNPEGRNMPGISYQYARPVGALFGGIEPDSKNSLVPSPMSWEDYYKSEACLDGGALLTSALMIASNGGSDYYEKKCENCSDAEPTPITDNDVYATAYTYEFGGMEMFHLGIYNSSLKKKDSVATYIYFDATEKEVEECKVVFSLDICLAYDQAGFNKPCANEKQLLSDVRSQLPQKVEGSYNKKNGTYTWVKTITLDSINLGSKVQMDIGVGAGVKGADGCDPLLTTSTVKLSEGWSFTAHKASKDAPAYDGVPTWNKEQGDLQDAPKDPYIVIRSKGDLLWGYGPASETDDRVGIRKIAVAPTATAKMVVEGRKLMVQATAQGSKTLKIFDILGNQLMAQTFDGTSAQVSLANFPRGAMIAKLMQNDKVLSTKAFKLK